MKKTWNLIQFYFLWQPVLLLVFCLGLLFFVLKIPASFVSENLTFALGMGAFAFLLVIPFCSGSTALRTLISNPHTSMVPGFRLKAGIAHLLIGVTASIYLYINMLIFATEPVSPIIMVYVFIALSCYAGFMQLILPSRYFIPLISFSPFIFVTILVRFREPVAAMLHDLTYITVLFILSLLGWAYGLYILNSKATFKPVNSSLNDTSAWASYDGGLLTHMAFGQARSAEGTLLLGYPDNWLGIFLRVAYFYLVTPLVTTGAMVMVGFTENWDGPLWQSIMVLFMAISLFSATFCMFIYGELVARARLLWLRFGTDRLTQWELVDSYCRKFLLVYFLCGGLITVLAMLFTSIPATFLLHYNLLLIAYCCFNLYFSLMVRARRLSPLILVLVVIMTFVVLIFGLIPVLNDENGGPAFGSITVVECLLLVLGLFFRNDVKQVFTGIDWKLVTIKPLGKMALTQD